MRSMSIGEAAEILGVSVLTLRRWHRSGKLIPSFRSLGGHRRYDADLVHRTSGSAPTIKTVCYARVSCHDQKDDLKRQADRLQDFCTANGWRDVEIIQDLGSGLNYGKKGLVRLLGLICRRQVGRIVIENKDRLLRFGAELVFFVAGLFGVEIVISDAQPESFESRLVHDVIELMTVFSARLYGARSHRRRKLATI